MYFSSDVDSDYIIHFNVLSAVACSLFIRLCKMIANEREMCESNEKKNVFMHNFH